MRWKKNLYFAHRWLGLIVGLQLLAWSSGGLMFSLLDIDNVHGDLERANKPSLPIRMDRVSLPPADALEAAARAGILPENVTRLSLRQRRDRIVFELFDPKDEPLGAVDAGSGEVILRISEAEARAAALADFVPGASVASIELLEGEAPGEFRGRPMPVYRVVLDHPKNPHLYISPVTGDVLARRNAPWRLFDFFWMLHIMDYGERTSFNHWLLTAASVLAILTSLSGIALWIPRLSTSLARGKTGPARGRENAS